MFSNKINQTITVTLYVIGLLYAIGAIISLIIWLTDMTSSNFLAFVGTVSGASVWLLLGKLSRYLDSKMNDPEEEEDNSLPDYLDD